MKSLVTDPKTPKINHAHAWSRSECNSHILLNLGYVPVLYRRQPTVLLPKLSHPSAVQRW